VHLHGGRVLKKARAPAGCKTIPVAIQNIFSGGTMYQVKGKSALIKELIHEDI
jgi:hypothetical protein